jgi:NitT/TauT family transport system substrate-binding protein
MEQVANLWQIYAVGDVQECADLHGRRFAVSNENAVNAKMTDVFIAADCPGTQPQIVIIQGSSNRAAALLAGEIDATPIELADAIQLAHDAPGQFHTLTNFGQELPRLTTSAVFVNREFAAANPQAVRDYIKALLTVHRQLAQDHELVSAEAGRRLGIDPEILPEVTEAYFDINAWDVNGGLAEADLEYTLEFFTATGDLQADLAVDEVADLSYLEAVLAEIGHEQ